MDAFEIWVSFEVGSTLPHNALIAGVRKFSDSDQEYCIGRKFFESKGLLMVTYYPTVNRAFIYDAKGNSTETSSFEMLTGHNHIWIATKNYEVPSGAVAFGVNDKGEDLFVSRMGHVGSFYEESSSSCCLNPSSRRFEQYCDGTIGYFGCQVLVRCPFDLKLLNDKTAFAESLLSAENKENLISMIEIIFKFMKVDPRDTQEMNLAKYYFDPKKVADQLSNLQLEDKKTEDLCSICLESEKNAVFLPCRHLSCCFQCASTEKNRTQKCPICRSNVQSVISIFKS